MSSELRPRRTTRAPRKTPVVLASSASNIAPVDDAVSFANEVGSNLNGKRDAPLDDKVEEIFTGKEADSGTKNKALTKSKGKSRAAKSNKAEHNLYDIDFILTNSKSPLVNMDITDVLNYGSWIVLSPESRAKLCKLLPDVVLGKQNQELDDSHPSRRCLEGRADETRKECCMLTAEVSMQANEACPSQTKAEELLSLEEHLLDPLFFKDPHFESAARTFQDHLYSGWFTSAHRELIDKHVLGISDGLLHAPWKDDAWDRDHPEVNKDTMGADDVVQDPFSSRRGKESKTSDFHPLVQKGFLKQGDIVTLKHKFSLGIAVEKDALITGIHPKTSGLTLTTSSSTTRNLPTALLLPCPNGPTDLGSLREMTVSTATQLVTALLDIDGRISREKRPRLDTWKVLSVWQWPTDLEPWDMSADEANLLERGGRLPLGTLFYLRGQALED